MNRERTVNGTDLDVSWAAGLIDGEGCITIYRRVLKSGYAVYSLKLCLHMGHAPTLERLKSLFGCGYIIAIAQKCRNDSFLWTCNAKDAQFVLSHIHLYSLTKKEEIRVALEFMSLMITTDGRRVRADEECMAKREEYFLQLRRLKPSSRFRYPELFV